MTASLLSGWRWRPVRPVLPPGYIEISSKHPRRLAPPRSAGAIAGLVFLGPVMALLFARLKNVEGLKRFASLLLHNGETVAEALPVLDSAIRLAPQDAEFVDRRGSRRRCSDGTRKRKRIGRGMPSWRPPAMPATSRRDGFSCAGSARPMRPLCSKERLVGASQTVGHWSGWASAPSSGGPTRRDHRSRGDPGQSHDALSLTLLAEAYLAAGDAKQAAQTATDAIDELDSIHGRTWLVRGDARRLIGDIDGAARDYDEALGADDETGVQEQRVRQTRSDRAAGVDGASRTRTRRTE